MDKIDIQMNFHLELIDPLFNREYADEKKYATSEDRPHMEKYADWLT